jgi:hypothetical protein
MSGDRERRADDRMWLNSRHVTLKLETYGDMEIMPDNIFRGFLMREIRKMYNTECGPERVYAVSGPDLDNLKMRIGRERLSMNKFMKKCVEREMVREFRSAVISTVRQQKKEEEEEEEASVCQCARCRNLKEEENDSSSSTSESEKNYLL